jgi:flagellar motility protein MotE (MotC chaperone)
MKFVGKILIYLVVMVINALAYLVIMCMAMGLNFSQSTKFVTTKISDLPTMLKQPAKELDKAALEKQEFDKEKLLVEAQKEELKQQKQQITKEKEDLESVKKQIQDLLGTKTKAQEDKMYSLAKIFDGMEKGRVAQVFGEMNDSLIVSILPKMKPANASLVLQFMEPGRSAQISRMILGGI